jgi:hypothetical protein
MNKRVCIVGANQLTRNLIDWNQDDTDYWLFNEMAQVDWAIKCDGLFQLHTPKIWRNPNNNNHVGHYAYLQEPHDFPIFMQDVYPDVPSSVKYPLDELCAALLPTLHRKSGASVKYFTSSAAYAIALAIYKGYSEIEMIGIEMTSDTEYVAQRDGVTFWMGIAIGRGIDVQIHDKSLLLRSHLYGYTGEITLQRQRLEIVARALAPKVEIQKSAAFELSGKVNTILKQLAEERNSKRAQKLYEELITAFNQQSDMIFQYGVLQGQLNITQQYIAEVDSLIAASGGERALKALQDVEAQK